MMVMDDDGVDDDSDGFEVNIDGWSMEVRRCTMKREEGKKRKEKGKKGWRDGGFIYLWAGPDWKSSPLSSETSLIVAGQARMRVQDRF